METTGNSAQQRHLSAASNVLQALLQSMVLLQYFMVAPSLPVSRKGNRLAYLKSFQKENAQRNSTLVRQESVAISSVQHKDLRHRLTCSLKSQETPKPCLNGSTRIHHILRNDYKLSPFCWTKLLKNGRRPDLCTTVMTKIPGSHAHFATIVTITLSASCPTL